jgi:hypothetical protein
MFNDVHIRGYRGIRDAHVRGLGRVNIIVGPGGAGKTSLLEALFLHSGAGHAGLSFGTLTSRGIDPEDRDRESLARLLEGLATAGLPPGASAEVDGAWAGTPRRSTVVTERGRLVQVPVQRGGFLGRGAVSPVVSIGLTTVHGEAEAAGWLHVLADALLDEPAEGAPPFRAFLVGASPSASSRDCAGRWEKVVDRGLEPRILELLKRVHPDLESVRQGSDSEGRSVTKFRTRTLGEVDQPQPLGNGFARAFQLSTGFGMVPGGVYLVDELDAFLHVASLGTVVRFVVDAARDLDVQVFLTTHRLETIDTFLELPQINDVRVIRARRDPTGAQFEVLDAERANQLREGIALDLRLAG